MEYLFYQSTFDKDISLWEFNKDVKYSEMFTYNKNFRNKYNNGIILPQTHDDIKLWLKENLINIREINTTKEEVLDFFSFDKEKEIGIN